MLAHLLAFADHTVASALPSITGVSTNGNAGFCNFDSVGQAATIDVNFTVINQAAGYEVHILRDGYLAATLALTATQYEAGAPGDVEFGGQSQFSATVYFAVQLVRISDGVVVQEVTTSYSSTWGTCR